MPAREPMSRLVINMHVLDGAPRITHIWPYAGVDKRAIRAKSYADGIWPPKGGCKDGGGRKGGRDQGCRVGNHAGQEGLASLAAARGRCRSSTAARSVVRDHRCADGSLSGMEYRRRWQEGRILGEDNPPGGDLPFRPQPGRMSREGERITAELAGLDDGTDPFAAAVRATRMPMIVSNPRDADNPIVFANDAFCRLTGYTREEILGRNCRFLQGPETDPAAIDRIRAAVAAEEPIEIDVRNHRKDGSAFWNRLLVAPVNDAAGALNYFFASQFDVSSERDQLAARTRELAEAEARLQSEAGERAHVEEALRQSLKMEAVGQLTGGIAHDFNNMLQAISGSLDLMMRRAEQGRAGETVPLMQGARRTVDRAAALTNRLLAFARRQALQPMPVVLDALVEGMADLIRNTVGPGVQVGLDMGDGEWIVLCDPNQMESALLNLAINARDAMPGGGRLRISTRDVALTAADLVGQDGARPGAYVELSVADTGSGMSEATRARALEPFFTTKPIGQGTGLGLSQIYGFVRQSGGVVRLDSTPGQGTTVLLYFPKQGTADAQRQPPAPQSAPGDAAGTATVLLVEDQDDVRAVAAERLRELGYVVLEAGDGSAALPLLRSEVRVDLLVTDVGLPGGLNGRQIADAARERRPGLPVLFITGYAGNALQGQLAPGMQVIGKPFALDALAAKVRTMLEGAGGR